MMSHSAITLTLLFALVCALFISCKKEDEKTEPIIERGTVSDMEGHTYSTVKIGDQWWMAENLRSSQFNDGTPLNEIDITSEDSVWAEAQNPTFTFINDTLFGYLYNGACVISSKNLAPIGWHIPTDQDWKKLEKAIGMAGSEINQSGWRGERDGEKITSKYSVGWPEDGELFGSDTYGFNALPGGCRIFDGRTNIFSNTAFWWTKTPVESELWYRYLDAGNKKIFRQHTYVQYGMSIRCVKD